MYKTINTIQSRGDGLPDQSTDITQCVNNRKKEGWVPLASQRLREINASQYPADTARRSNPWSASTRFDESSAWASECTSANDAVQVLRHVRAYSSLTEDSACAVQFKNQHDTVLVFLEGFISFPSWIFHRGLRLPRLCFL